ncbi:unnamed protein product [Ceutorhynchus assimilis]|uniref:Serine aminopeptidase S33 domain-containing protein n=1 Tax=Ceutorhynchus assimilis TaxID=467358 RepID=A0A9N9MC33_9CUCU|nr:unnamed protein product [Ceutorhynchus assimilis]
MTCRKKTKDSKPLWKVLLKWFLTITLTTTVISSILIWVVLPVAFWLSVAFQTFAVFMPIDFPKNPNFNNPQQYNITGVKNFYITVKDYYNNETLTQIGAWLVLPKGLNKSEDVSDIIRKSEYDILIYSHGVLANRARYILQYEVFRRYFLVLAMDHRGYGDSGQNVPMTELGIVNDHLQIYDWLTQKNFSRNIYYWGHSMGAAITCHTLKTLKSQRNFTPKGVIFESAFTSLQEQIVNMFLGKVFKWLPYFDATILRPLAANELRFDSINNILHVDCPIMMLHAQDDGVIPYFLGEKLARVARSQRDLAKQGNVTFHLIPSSGNCNHDKILTYPDVPSYIENFKEVCELFKEST